MRAVIKALYTINGEKLDGYKPSMPLYDAVRAILGPDGGEGEESFDFTICSPDGLAEKVKKWGALGGRHHIIVDHFDADEIRRFIQKLCEQNTGNDWSEIGDKIARYGYWEFEDYTE